MRIGARVELVTFDGKRVSPPEVLQSEDYWKLVGQTGTVIHVEEERPHFAESGHRARDCVRFDIDPVELGLEAHNRVAKSLWILRSDLREMKK